MGGGQRYGLSAFRLPSGSPSEVFLLRSLFVSVSRLWFSLTMAGTKTPLPPRFVARDESYDSPDGYGLNPLSFFFDPLPFPFSARRMARLSAACRRLVFPRGYDPLRDPEGRFRLYHSPLSLLEFGGTPGLIASRCLCSARRGSLSLLLREVVLSTK